MAEIVLAEGKYTVHIPEKPGDQFYAWRYGEYWRSLTGDGLVLAMAQRITELEGQIAKTSEENG